MLSLVGVLGSLYPVATVLLARFILKEKLMAIQYVGVIAAFIGVIAIGAG
jgi:EamA domain-containing membrane protein RarD